MSSPCALSEVRDFYLERTRRVALGLRTLAAKHSLPSLAACTAPPATFYVWADFSSCAGVESDTLIFQRLLALGVAVVPGSAFSVPPELRLVRLSCAQDSLDALDAALAAIDLALGEWARLGL